MHRLTATQPIGIFDSGIGGLTIARAIVDRMPEENIIYFGDTAHLPYGDKSPATIKTRALKITDMLLEQGCKLILIACNSASTAAGMTVETHAGERAIVMDVIDPVIQSLGKVSPQHKIGLIGTRQTVQSGIYRDRLKAIHPDIHLSCRATNLLASAIEEFGNSRVTDSLIEEYLSDPLLNGIKSLILACTHYPVIKEKIAAFFGGKVRIIDSSESVALALENSLLQHRLRNFSGVGQKHFYVSDYTESFLRGARRFFSEPIRLEHYPSETPHELPSHLACRELC